LTAALFSETSPALVKKHLSPDLYQQLRYLKTRSGFTLEKAIRSGIRNPDSSIGIYAGDAESYQVFSPIFDPIIHEYHHFPEGNTHVSDFTAPDLPPADPDGKYILSTRIRVARNLQDYEFSPQISLSHRKGLEETVIKALATLKGDLGGEYVSLKNIEKNPAQPLKSDILVFTRGDRFQEAAGINAAVQEAERNSSAEIKVVLTRHCWGDIRAKAHRIFKRRDLDRTQQRNAVLLLFVVANREFLIYGGEGIHAKVGQDFWNDVRDEMAAAFGRDEFGAGTLRFLRHRQHAPKRRRTSARGRSGSQGQN